MPRRKDPFSFPPKLKYPSGPPKRKYPRLSSRHDPRRYSGPAEPGDPEVVALIREAIQRKKCLAATYQGLPRVLCPHVLGTLRQDRRLFAYQVGGESASGEIDAEEEPWRAIRVAKLEDVRLSEGSWAGSGANPFVRHQMDDVEGAADAVSDAVIPDYVRERWNV